MGFNTDTAPASTNWSMSESGKTKHGLAKLCFLQTFLPHISTQQPQIFVLDRRDSHNFLKLVDIGITNRIHVVEKPAHISNWPQLCDRTIFKPLKNYYRESAHNMINNLLGVVTCRANFTWQLLGARL